LMGQETNRTMVDGSSSIINHPSSINHHLSCLFALVPE
jgi:hypothetical protein